MAWRLHRSAIAACLVYFGKLIPRHFWSFATVSCSRHCQPACQSSHRRERLRKELTISNVAIWRSDRLRRRVPRGKLAVSNMETTFNVDTLVKAHCHGARSRNQQRKAIDLKLRFKIAA